MRKRTQILAPALVAGILLLGGYRLAARPLATRPRPAIATTAPANTATAATGEAVAAASPALLAAAGAVVPAGAAVLPPATPVPSTIAAATVEPTDEPTATGVPTATAPPPPSATPQPTEPPPTATQTRTPQPRPVPPDRIVAPAIGLDAKVVTVGWHEVVDPDGSTHTEWDVASYAAGWHKNSAKPGQVGNVVLSGHNNIEGEVFRNLEKFEIGDQITLYAGERSFTYVVSEKFTVLDKGASYEERVKNAQWIGPFPDERLTLVSCWPPTNNTHRMFIIAKPQH